MPETVYINSGNSTASNLFLVFNGNQFYNFQWPHCTLKSYFRSIIDDHMYFLYIINETTPCNPVTRLRFVQNMMVSGYHPHYNHHHCRYTHSFTQMCKNGEFHVALGSSVSLALTVWGGRSMLKQTFLCFFE